VGSSLLPNFFERNIEFNSLPLKQKSLKAFAVKGYSSDNYFKKSRKLICFAKLASKFTTKSAPAKT